MAMASRELGLAAAEVGGGGNGCGEEDDLSAIATEEEMPEEGMPAVGAGGHEAAPGDLVPVITVEEVDGIELEVHEEGADEEEEAEMAAEGDAEWDGEGEGEGVKGWLKPYTSTHSILIVGDGDFSFSWALAVAFCSAGNLVATSLDSYEALSGKYSKVESNILLLKMMGATILHGIDVKTMKLHTDLKMRRFDRIIFNFPHAWFKGKEDHMDVTNAHKRLVSDFLHNASHLIRPNGEIHVAHKTGFPYDKWDIEKLALESSLIMVEKVRFRTEDYPGYNQKVGDTCRFKFRIGYSKKLKSVHINRISSTPSLGSSTLSHPQLPEPVNTTEIAQAE